MQHAALVPLDAATASSVATVEVGLVTAAVVLLVALVLLKARRDHDLRIRRAASIGYHDPDAARYGHGSVAPPSDTAAVDTAHLPLAPSFVAPGRTPGSTRLRPSPSPAAPSSRPPGPVPAFDPVEAINARPVSTGDPEPGARLPLPSPPPADPPLPRLDRPPSPGTATTLG
jgi:hypothetical protein